ncbi:hypothetical protein C0992_003484, partial [Termitomyces sp. T32_za158]
MLTPEKYAQLRMEWDQMQELESNEGQGNAEVEESLFDNDPDDLLKAMNEAKQE